MTERTEGQVTWSDLGLWSGKTCPEPSAATKGETLRQSSKRSSASQNRKPPILKCLKKAGQLGGDTTMKWEDDGAWLGECMTRNTGESPNAAVVSRLSQILEETPQEKYSLSAKACQGILRRAERRGKDLPKLLKQVLLMQSGSGGGCDGGGKGALVQEDKSGTLGTGNDQTIFCLQGNGIDRADTAGCNGKGWREDTSYTLNTIDRPAVCAGVRCLTSWDAQSQRVYDGNGVSPTLSSRENSGLNREAVLCAGFKAGQGAQAGGIGYGEEVSPTLAAVPSGTNRTPAVVAYSFDSLSSNSMKSKNPHSGCREVDVAKTLDTTDPTPSKNQGGIAVVCAGFKLGNSEHTRSIGYAEEQAPTLNAECGGNKPAVMRLNDQGGNVMGVSHDVSGTLRAQEHGHQPAVIAFAQNQREEVRNVGDKAVSLAAEVGMHCQTFVALDMSHACDVIRDCGEVAPSLQARMGTGGNQIPLTYQDVTGTLSPGAHAGSYNGQDAYNDMLVCGATPDVARAILYQPKSAMEENWAASETKNALRAGESKVSHAVMCEDVSHALRANGACAYREDAETYPVQNMVVRRLTPMECERLQGFPDGWTDIGEWRDSKGKLRKPSDSPRYKALGNSIALPFWDFLAKRISAQYIRPVTMGSLFDGIGGFPLVFERHNGKGTARWASEIEEFPIAVTKLRFGGEDNGSQEVLLAEAEA